MTTKGTLANNLWNEKWEEFKEEKKFNILLAFANTPELIDFFNHCYIDENDFLSFYTVTFRNGNSLIEIKHDNEMGLMIGLTSFDDDVLTMENKTKITELLEDFQIHDAIKTISITKNEELKVFMDYFKLDITNIQFANQTYCEGLYLKFNENPYLIFNKDSREDFMVTEVRKFIREEESRLKERFSEEYSGDKWWDHCNQAVEKYGEDYFINKNQYPRIEYNDYYIYQISY